MKSWLLYISYLLCLSFSIYYHELWGDELHSWNIAKNSSGLSDLILNSRYEGHPPVWYILLFILSKFTHDPVGMQYLQFSICACMVFVFIFKTELDFLPKTLILFGYYFLYEYGSFSRNYAIALLFILMICRLLKNEGKLNYFLYYSLLLIISNIHMLALLMSVSLHAYYLIGLKERKSKSTFLKHFFIGSLIFLPALYFIFPPSDSSLNSSFWISRFNKDLFFSILQSPVKSLCPIPAWWKYHFWNTNALLELQKIFVFFKFINPLISTGLIIAILYFLYPAKRILFFFVSNLVLTALFGLIFPLTSSRYVGFIFISFIVSLLLCGKLNALDKKRKSILFFLLGIQLIGSCVAIWKDYKYPFANGAKIQSLADKLPTGAVIVTDYWCLNYISAYLDKPVYCLGFDSEKSFLLWNSELKAIMNEKNRLTKALAECSKKDSLKNIYFFTNVPEANLLESDSLLFSKFNLQLISGQEDAIEAYGNINLYKVSKR